MSAIRELALFCEGHPEIRAHKIVGELLRAADTELEATITQNEAFRQANDELRKGWNDCYETNQELRAEIKKYRDIFAIDENGKHTKLIELIADNAAMSEKLADYDEYYLSVINEKCAGDELHCTCVPALRKEIETLRATIEEARDLARTGLPPDEFNMDERVWNIHKLNKIAGMLAAALRE